MIWVAQIAIAFAINKIYGPVLTDEFRERAIVNYMYPATVSSPIISKSPERLWRSFLQICGFVEARITFWPVQSTKRGINPPFVPTTLPLKVLLSLLRPEKSAMKQKEKFVFLKETKISDHISQVWQVNAELLVFIDKLIHLNSCGEQGLRGLRKKHESSLQCQFLNHCLIHSAYPTLQKYGIRDTTFSTFMMNTITKEQTR